MKASLIEVTPKKYDVWQNINAKYFEMRDASESCVRYIRSRLRNVKSVNMKHVQTDIRHVWRHGPSKICD